MIKTIYGLSLFILFAFSVNGQETKTLPLFDQNSDWFSGNDAPAAIKLLPEAVPLSLRAGQNLTITVYGRTRKDEYIYSILPQGEYSPKPTFLKIHDVDFTPIKPPEQSTTKIVYDEAFERKLAVHRNDFWIRQTYRISRNAKKGRINIPGDLTYQICSKKICSFPIKSNFLVQIRME